MSISNAMASGVSGLMANSKAVEKISYNIANADTVGYRRSFSQMVTSGSNAATGSFATGVATEVTHSNTAEGTFMNTSVDSNLTITGSGFFVVNSNAETAEPSGNMFTRVGSFEPDQDGNLVNAAGLYLMGFAYGDDGALGAVDRASFDGLVPVNVASTTATGTATAAASISGNLPSQETGLATPGDAFVTSAGYYNALGESERLTMSFQPTVNDDEWVVSISDDTANYGSVTVTFNNSGANAGAPAAYTAVTSTAVAPAAFAFNAATGEMTLTIDNGTTPQTITMSLGAPGTFDGLTQFSGDYTPMTIEADGSASGTMNRVEFDQYGDVWGVFDNGTRKALYSIPLATFANPNGLETSNNSTFHVSNSSGGFYLGEAGSGETGTMTSGGVESANVDIAEELTSLIQRQRAYSSNAKIITTADEMLNETVNLKR
ncbi:flagellar hook-basal body complex protein [Salipiger bermudensis]|uniref:flagellar hook protein FlgE n=1 Tax=Salipiger bermudensis TaxID=344736 RepID=UPI001C99DB27|nr:flagellar hook-basal body complex protein [Salipiger bermudensis]MBY6006461.1 flagellar hook-basal body complex protein [Salipiger bermudensis]